MREIKRFRLPVAKQMSHMYEMHSVGCVAKDYVKLLYDAW